MRIITGPPGSGKTSFVLDRLREALRAGNSAVRLLAPTATLAQHLQNQVAREGFVFRGSLIQTLYGFIDRWVADPPQASDEALYLIVEDAVRRANRGEFARVAETRGFSAALARAIGEFSSAGCDSARLAANLPDTPLAGAFLAVYREVERELARKGMALRARRLELAAERIEESGADGIGAIWLDGFHALPEPELKVIHALARHAEVTITLEEAEGRLSGEIERLSRTRRQPAIALVKAPNIEREADEIARRILEQAAAGRPFREMGIVVRSKDIYVPLLRSTLGRFGIPSHFYFDSELEGHPAVRFLCGAVDAMLGGWDHASTLAVLRLAPRYVASNTMDRFDFTVRKQTPNAGLGALNSVLADMTGGERLLPLIESLAGTEEWRRVELTPKDWAARLATMRRLYRATAESPAGLTYALKAFEQALGEAAQALDTNQPMRLEPFWRAVKAIIRLKPLRIPDQRRNVVHVLPAHEARQWVVPVVFVCGMVEKQFPQFHPQDAFFPEPARCQLNAAGIHVRTHAEFEREERALFDSAISRATILSTLSYPEYDARAERNLPSIYLEDLMLPPQESRPVRPVPRHTRPAQASAVIQSPAVFEWLRQRTARLSPTGLETYLQCPFQFFAQRILGWKTAPQRPDERLDFLTQGNIVHESLKLWYADSIEMEQAFAGAFARYMEKERIPDTFRTERLRVAMVENLLAFAADPQWPRKQFQSESEKEFSLTLGGLLEIAGRIDRIDTGADGRAYVLDYKYSGTVKNKRRDPNVLQAPIYLMAAERTFGLHPVGVFYVGLKGGIEYAGWSDAAMLGSDPLPADWLQQTETRILGAVAEIRGGRVAPCPADGDKCRYCDYRDACRFESRAAAAIAEGA